MREIYAHLRPKLMRLGGQLAPELGRRFHQEVFLHVAKHAQRTVNPPPETWAAFGPSPRGYKRYAYLALCVSGSGLHARVVVKPEADRRVEMARALRAASSQLVRALGITPVARYQKWDFRSFPTPARASSELFDLLAENLARKNGGLDLGFGWTVKEALRLDPAELLDAFGELEPIYRILHTAKYDRVASA